MLRNLDDSENEIEFHPVFLLLTSATMLAQKIDQRLTGLVKQNNVRRAQGLTVNQQKSTYNIAAGYDQDGNIRSVGVQAYLKQGASVSPHRRVRNHSFVCYKSLISMLQTNGL